MERHGYDDGVLVRKDSPLGQKPSVFPAVFLLKMLKWIIIRSKKKWREFLKKWGNFFTVIM